MLPTSCIFAGLESKMSKQDEALEILRAFGLPRAQQNERSALTLLALAGLGSRDSWAKTRKPSLRIWDIMGFMRDKYGKDYAANSRETIRRQTELDPKI